MRLAESGVRKPVMTLMVFLAILVLGYVSFTKLAVDMMPEIETPSVSVITRWTGASTSDMETKVTRIVENALASVTDLEEITSSTSEGTSRVSCKFKWGTSIGDAANDIRDLLERAKRTLPEDVDTPFLFKFNSANMPVIFYGITARENREAMDKVVNDEIVDVLKRVRGVGSVEAMGGLTRQVNIFVDPAKLSAYGVTLTDIANALKLDNISEPAGNLKVGTTDYTIRVPGEFAQPLEVGGVIVKRSGDALVRLEDIATVEDGFVEVSGTTEMDGKWGMIMMVQKRSGENTVDVCRRVNERVEEIKKNLPADYEIRIVSDTSDAIQKSISSVGKTILYGGIFVILTTLFFLRNWRTSLIITLTIPFSIIIAFVFMYAMGWTINLMSLSALAVAIGLVVDNAVVVLESIATHIERGTKRREAAMFATEEVGLAVMVATCTTIVVFLPLIFVKGISGIMMRQLGGLVTVTLSASLFCALYLTPMLASILLKDKWSGGKERKEGATLGAQFMAWSEQQFIAFENGYGRLVSLALKWWWAVVAAAAGIMVATVYMFSFVGSEFMGEEDTGELRISFDLPVGTRYEVTTETGRKLVALCKEIIGTNNITVISMSVGTGTGFGGARSSNAGTVQARLVSASQRPFSTDVYGDKITKIAKAWPEMDKMSSTSGAFMNRMLRGGGANLLIEIYGYELDETLKIAKQISQIAEETEGTRGIRIPQNMGRPELIINVDRLRAASLGLTMNSITKSLSTLFQGAEATRYREGENEYAILIRLDAAQRTSIEDINGTEITTPSGGRVRIDSFAEVQERLGPVNINRKNQGRLVTVELDSIGRSQGEVMADIRARIEKEVLLPMGVSIEYAGAIKDQQETERDMKMMIVLGILLIYMVMAAQFESFRHPFLIMFSMPFAFSGVAAALLISKTPISMIGYIGIILLVGIVVNNAILLIDYINLLRERGEALHEAIVNSGRRRLRPVLITTCTTLLAMLPMALSTGDGSAQWRPLGLVVVGGLTVSTLVTMIIVPVLYYITERLMGKGREQGNPINVEY